MLFNVTIPEVPAVVIDKDSIKTTVETLIQEVKEAPDVFFQDLLQDIIQFGIKVLAALLIYIVGAWLIRRIKQILQRYFTRKKTDATIATFIGSFTSFMLTILLIVVTVGTLGVDTTSLAALLAAGGMAIGMSLSGTVQNLAGGIMILLFKPFKVGDFITTQGFSGTVKAVSIVSTKIRTTDNREIIMPNGALSNSNIDNYSTQPIRRIEWIASVEYGIDADNCINLLRNMLLSDSRILSATTPGAADPFVALSSLNANDISFVMRAWVKADDFWPVTYDINKEIYTQLPQHGMGFAYPRLDVTLTRES